MNLSDYFVNFKGIKLLFKAIPEKGVVYQCNQHNYF